MTALADTLALATLPAIALALAGLFLAGIVKGATGLGYTTCALPFLVYGIGLTPAITLVMLPAMATNAAVAFQGGRVRSTCVAFAPLYISMLSGIGCGVWLLVHIDHAVAVRLLGIIITVYAIATLSRPRLVLSRDMEEALQVPVGLLNGIVTGLTGSQVMPIVPYFLALDLTPDRIIQAINLAVTLASLAMIAGLTASGLAAQSLLLASIAAIPPALAGVHIGQMMRRHIAPDRTRTAILVVLAIAGAGMLLK